MSIMGGSRTTSPEPMVRSPRESVALRHPTPDLQSLQGAYVGNVERLENEAERLSLSGSELGEEIRKLHQEQKLADSRRSSLMSTPLEPVPTTRSRNASTSSYTNSIVDLNNAARWGGYSPGGYITSPIGSLRSGSWSQQPTVKRHASVTRASRLDQVIQHEELEGGGSGASTAHHPDSGLTSVAHLDNRSQSPNALRHLLNNNEDRMRTGSLADGDHGVLRDPQEVGESGHIYGREEDQDGDHYNTRPGTAGSGDTYQQARSLFQDFDGVHYSPTEEHPPREGENRHSMVPTIHHSPPAGLPPPRDSMVFYPAPVPRMLNLPKRLSQMPSTNVQAKRRTQVLGSMPAAARKSAVWLSGEVPPMDEPRSSLEESPQQKRKTAEFKRKTMANLPPQLRASMFFDQQGISQDVEVKGESAADTLDSILDASARAPVGAFTDHPFAGRLGAEVYGKEPGQRKDPGQRRNTLSLLETNPTEARKSRSSVNLNQMFARRESGEQPNKLRKRQSQLSLSAQLEISNIGDDHVQTEDKDGDHHSFHRKSLDDSPVAGDKEDDFKGEDTPTGPEPQYFGPPTTLLAELQMRKQQQRTRNKTAATAFPNGMHATLLELDAVAQIEKERRKVQRVALAWEDPALKAKEEQEDEDEDVPLGMLFPGKNGLVNKKIGPLGKGPLDWDRPIGLIEQREMEDNEPLSKRRNRLKGYDPNRRPSPVMQPYNGNVPPPSEAPADEASREPEANGHEEEGETLAQRIRRLKSQKALDSALEDVKARPVSEMFASEMLSQFGGVGGDEKEKTENETPGKAPSPESEEETLGQRRARLQREALARGGTQQGQQSRQSTAFVTADGPVLKQSRSMADLLSAHPAAQANQAHKVSNDVLLESLPAGSLLQRNEVLQAKFRRNLQETNKRSSSFGLDRPLVNVGQDKDWDTPLGLLGQPGGGNSKGVSPNMAQQLPMNQQMQMQMQMQMGANPMAGMQMQMPMMNQNPMMMPQMGMWPQQGQMGMGMGMGMGMPMQMGMQMPVGMYQQPGMAMGGMNMPGMGMPMTYAANAQMQMQGEAMMDPRQRDMIDRWRQGIM